MKIARMFGYFVFYCLDRFINQQRRLRKTVCLEKKRNLVSPSSSSSSSSLHPMRRKSKRKKFIQFSFLLLLTVCYDVFVEYPDCICYCSQGRMSCVDEHLSLFDSFEKQIEKEDNNARSSAEDPLWLLAQKKKGKLWPNEPSVDGEDISGDPSACIFSLSLSVSLFLFLFVNADRCYFIKQRKRR